MRKTPSAVRACLIPILLWTLLATPKWAWAQPPVAASQQQPAPPADTGGPQGEIGPIAIPQKPQSPPAAPPPPPAKSPEKLPSYSLSVNVPLVTLEAVVLTKDGQFIPGLKQDNFRVSEDGVPQQLTAFSQTQAPITAVMLIEFASNNYTNAFLSDALRAAYVFASGLRKDDWVALIEFDLRPNILLDFTQDKTQVMATLGRLRVPGFSERNLFDALYDTLDRVGKIKGRKVVLLIGTGVDSFSKTSYDQVLKKIKQTPEVRIFSISTGRAFNEWFDARYGQTRRGQMRSLDYMQADNQMETFAKASGGRWYNPRFQAEFNDIFRDISSSVRQQYTLGYKPTNQKLDGTFRKVTIELVDPQTGRPLVIRDRKNKEQKYTIVTREGYTARLPVQ